MMNRQMELILTHLEQTQTFTAYHPQYGQPCRYQTVLQPVVLWEPRHMARDLDLMLPDDLRAFWMQTGGLNAWCETDDWSLRLWSPFEAFFSMLDVSATLSNQLCAGDLIIGDYQDGAAWLVVRCRADAYDFGRVCVALADAPRDTWQVVADSLSDFLQRTIELPQVDYWLQTTPDALFPCA